MRKGFRASQTVLGTLHIPGQMLKGYAGTKDSDSGKKLRTRYPSIKGKLDVPGSWAKRVDGTTWPAQQGFSAMPRRRSPSNPIC